MSCAGDVERVAAEETRAYWATRPRGSQLGAWASAQSSYVARPDALDAVPRATERRFADADEIPVPPHWGGWRIVPDRVEFWQGRARTGCTTGWCSSRTAHDRSWQVRRLAP